MEENRFLKQAQEELAYLSGDPGFQRLVEAREGFLRDQYSYNAQAKRDGRAEGKAEGRAEGKAEGRAEGKAEGEKRAKEEMAKELLKLKMPIEQIMKVTKLTKEEILNLEEEIEDKK